LKVKYLSGNKIISQFVKNKIEPEKVKKASWFSTGFAKNFSSQFSSLFASLLVSLLQPNNAPFFAFALVALVLQRQDELALLATLMLQSF
jgi:hypothetical protein